MASVTAILTAILVVCVTYVIASFISHVRRALRLQKALASVPGPPRHVLYGNMHQHPGPGPGMFPFLEKLTEEFKRISILWLGPLMPMVSVYHPDTMKVIFKSSEPKFTDGNGAYSFLFGWLGDGLLLSSGPKWFRNRRLLTPAFHFEILKPYLDVYHQSVAVFMEKMRKACETGSSVDIYSHVSLLTLDTILRCAFSYEADIQTQGKNNPYVSAVMELSDIILYRFLKPLLHFPMIFALSPYGWRFRRSCKYAHTVAEDIIAKRRKQLAESTGTERKRYLDFLDILLSARDDEGQGLTGLEIRNEVDTFLFEGHDTTASGISWLLYEMAKHPEIQNKAREEVLDLARERNDQEQMEWDDLTKLTYVTQCIKESMRVHPPVPLIGRQLSQDVVIDGYTIPKGVYVDVNIHMLHHNPLVWGPDHMDYKPERFHPDKMKDMDPFAFVPFSAGPRNCIGQNFAMNEVKVVISRILQKFDLRLDPEHQAVPIPEVVTRSADGIKIIFTPRS